MCICDQKLVMFRYWSAVSNRKFRATSLNEKKAPILTVLFLLDPRNTVKQRKS